MHGRSRRERQAASAYPCGTGKHAEIAYPVEGIEIAKNGAENRVDDREPLAREIRSYRSGLFKKLDGAVFDHQILIDEKPTYYCFANETKNLADAKVFAQLTP